MSWYVVVGKRESNNGTPSAEVSCRSCYCRTSDKDVLHNPWNERGVYPSSLSCSLMKSAVASATFRPDASTMTADVVSLLPEILPTFPRTV